MIRLGTIGTSKICKEFLNSAASTNKFVHTSVYSRNRETGIEFAKSTGAVQVFTNLEDMAMSNCIDAVYIASPNSCHAIQSEILLKNNKHVLCEKTITTSKEEYSHLKKLADSKGLIYMEAIMAPHSAQHACVMDALSYIGPISNATIDFSQRSSRLDAFLNGERVNIFDMSLHAGALMDLGIYCVYAAIDFFGLPKTISACAKYLYNGADGSGQSDFYYDDFSATLIYDKTQHATRKSKIVGENGILNFKSISMYSGVSLIKDNKETIIVPDLDKKEVMKGEAQNFADLILNHKKDTHFYNKISTLCLNVHTCMDEIKNKAKINYN